MMAARTRLLLILSSLLAASCAKSDERERLPDLRMPTVAAQESPSLASCPTSKCLTAYVAPWCGYCRAATPMLLALRRFLGEHDVTTRFVVGKDQLPALRDYAQVFGPDAMLDVNDSLDIGGVPHFFVSDRNGVILKEISGVPAGQAPIAEIAAVFGLP